MRKGFSLLELLVAIGILSAGILVVLQATGLCARITGIANDTLNALLLAEDKMQELQYKEITSQLTPLTDLGKSGKYAWNYNLEPDPSLNLYECDFGVSWERPEREENLAINTYLRK